MWTLYDSTTRPAREIEAHKSLRTRQNAMIADDRRAPSTLEMLWFLLEPTSLLTSRNGLKPKAN